MKLTGRTLVYTFELTEMDVRNLRAALDKAIGSTRPEHEGIVSTLQNLLDELGAAL